MLINTMKYAGLTLRFNPRGIRDIDDAVVSLTYGDACLHDDLSGYCGRSHSLRERGERHTRICTFMERGRILVVRTAQRTAQHKRKSRHRVLECVQSVKPQKAIREAPVSEKMQCQKPWCVRVLPW